MKKSVMILCAMATVIGISTGNPCGGELKGNVAHASSAGLKTREADDGAAADKSKAEFAYEMAQITAKIIAAPNSAENFKVEFAYEMARVTAKVMPLLPDGQKEQFSYQMARLTTKIISDQRLDVEKAKAEFAYEAARLTSLIIAESGNTNFSGTTAIYQRNIDIAPQGAGGVNDSNTYQRETLLRNNADITPKTPAVKVNNPPKGEKMPVNDGYIAPETYAGLMDELTNVGDRGKQRDREVNVDGELRFHYRLNSGPGQWGRDSSGLRLRLGLDTELYKDWRLYGMVEGELSFLNYNNELNFSRLYAAGKLGAARVRAGSFGYLMADGNIYDSDFVGVSADFGGPLKYTLSYGKTAETKNTFITTVRYTDFDYSLEAGLYDNRLDNGKKNSIWTFGGNYNFSNFSVGAMYLGSSLQDDKGNRNGYVLSFNYGDLKTWRPGTYDLFAKYYNQPRGTYLAHGMNGTNNWMQDHGFRGYGLGVRYTFAENLVGGMEYFDLRDIVNGVNAQTWWNQLTYYF